MSPAIYLEPYVRRHAVHREHHHDGIFVAFLERVLVEIG
jgi:hypothetical protein